MADDARLCVVDTNVVSTLFRGGGEAQTYKNLLVGMRLVISFQTLEEIQFGVLNNRWGKPKREQMRRHLEQFEVIYPNRDIVEKCAQLRFDRRHRMLATADAWIAATALHLNCPLVTKDTDFVNTPDLDLLNPEDT